MLHFKWAAAADWWFKVVVLFEKVSEMKAEYFPPREDIILLNEAPSEFYIVVNGSAVSISIQCHWCQLLIITGIGDKLLVYIDQWGIDLWNCFQGLHSLFILKP